MHEASRHGEGWIRRLEWAARIGGLVSIGLLAALAFGDQEASGTPTAGEWVLLACFPGAVGVGMLLGWWRPLVGGLVTLGGLVGFHLIVGWRDGDWWSGPWFLVFAAPGLVFLLVEVARRSCVQHPEAPGSS